MRRRIVECVANFSEGRDEATVNCIASAVVNAHGVALLDRTMDPDHNRCVLTFAGPPESVSAAAVRAVAKAAELIDLTVHEGVHPRLGAADVVPFVPVEGVTLEECAELARRTGREIERTSGLPVYFYEAAALRPDRVRLEDVRRGGFEGLREAVRTDAAKRPDVGGPELHPTAGAVIVGARRFLIAWNVNLASDDLALAKAIARRIRASSGGFAHLKALGLPLRRRRQVQISMNLTDHDQTPMHIVFSEIRKQAGAAGIEVSGTEIIGLIPRGALEQAGSFWMQIENFRPGMVLERRIEEALPLGLEDFLDQVADPTQAIAGGSAVAISCALAASLGLLVCRLEGRGGGGLEEDRRFFLLEGEREHSSRPLSALLERATALAADLERLAVACADRNAADARTAAHLAAAARDALETRLQAIR